MGLAVCNNLAGVVVCAQELAHEFIETEPIGSSQIDCAIRWFSQGDIAQHGNHVIGQDGLDEGRG